MTARILVVDDEPMVRDLIVRALTAERHEVVAVRDGQAAVNAARTAEVGFDLIITNSWLPGLGGMEVIQQLRESFPNLPIIHIDDLPGRRESAWDGSDKLRTIYKPFSVETLQRTVRQLLDGRADRAPA